MLKIIDTISGFLDAFVSWRHFAPVMGLLACALPTLLLAIQLIMYVAYQPSLGFIRHSKKFVAKYGYVDQYFADKYGKKVVRRAGRNIYRSWRSTVACGDMLAAGDVLVKHVLARPLVPEVFTPSGLQRSVHVRVDSIRALGRRIYSQGNRQGDYRGDIQPQES